jgi:hypothetical protein
MLVHVLFLSARRDTIPTNGAGADLSRFAKFASSMLTNPS